MGTKEKITTGRRTYFLMLVVLSSFVFLLILSVIILASVPPVSRDALTQHLAIPKLYIRHGGIYEIPSMAFSYNPMNLDFLYLIPLYFGNDIIPKLIHFSFAILTAWLVFAYLRRRNNLIYAVLGALFFLSIPIIVKLSITAYVDLGLIFFSSVSLFSLLKWKESKYRPRFLIISAVSCGLAIGTKYNGLITFLLMTLFVPFIYSRYPQGKSPGFPRTALQGLIFAFISLMVFSPWAIRNYLWTNNPIFPLYDQLFNPQGDVAQASVSIFTFRSQVYGESWWEMALLPVRIFFQGQDGNPRFFDGKLNPFLLLMPFFAFYRVKNESPAIKIEKSILLAFVVLYFAFAFFSSSVRIRYISPIIPPLVVLSVFGVKNMVEVAERVSSGVGKWIAIVLIFGIVTFFLWLNAAYIITQYKKFEPFTFLSGTVSRDEYIEKFRLEYPAIRYANENLPADSRILFIFLGSRGYYCDRQYVIDMNRNISTLHQLVKSSDSPEKILHGLKEMGITHLLIHYPIFQRWAKSQFTDKDKKLLEQFFEKYVKRLYFKWGYDLSRLEDMSP